MTGNAMTGGIPDAVATELTSGNAVGATKEGWATSAEMTDVWRTGGWTSRGFNAMAPQAWDAGVEPSGDTKTWGKGCEEDRPGG